LKQFVNAILKGRVDKWGKRLEGNNDFFYRKQLRPIASLLRGEQLAKYANPGQRSEFAQPALKKFSASR
jgi:hypothetical protein